jgi:starch synthase
LKYGSVPVVRETGGLKDTVIPFDKYKGVGNGLTFKNFNAHELLFTAKRALSYYEDTALWDKLVCNAMESDYGWKRSANAYIDLYKKVLGEE